MTDRLIVLMFLMQLVVFVYVVSMLLGWIYKKVELMRTEKLLRRVRQNMKQK